MEVTSVQATWRGVANFLVWTVALMLPWEVFQLPLYALWHEASPSYITFSVIHCTIGDVVIALIVLIFSVLMTGSKWPARSSVWTALWLVTLGVGYTIYSETSNLARGAWSYSPSMPVLPAINIGLAPLLQWILLPPIILKLASAGR